MDQAITLYGTVWCSDCKRTKKFFAEQRVPYEFVDIDTNANGLALVEPSNAELAVKLGLQTRDAHAFHDLIVIGSGPAGLTAALYAAREGIETMVSERGGVGGQAGITERLDNFPGFPEGISGSDFAERLRLQAERFGVELLTAQEVTGIGADGNYRWVRTADGAEYRAWAILLAVGSTYRRVEIPGEEEFIGAGIHFCATCDGPFYRERDVLVIGGGNSAGEESLFLTKFANHVTIATRSPQLSASKVVVEKVMAHPRIEVLTNVEPAEFPDSDRLEARMLRDRMSGEMREVNAPGVFVFIGLTPNTEIARGIVELDARGFILANMALQTSLPGVVAAGDCRAGSTKQAASAAGEGAAAVLAIRRYVEPLASGIPCHDQLEAELAMAFA